MNIGSGIGGLCTTYEMIAQKSGAQVTILEALDRTGGRCLSHTLNAGPGVYQSDGTISKACFFIVGDQISSLPDTHLMVEGI